MGGTLGPKPRDDHLGKRPGGSGTGNQQHTTMQPNNNSRLGRAQGNPTPRNNRRPPPTQPEPEGRRRTVQGGGLPALHKELQDLAKLLHHDGQRRPSARRWQPEPWWMPQTPWGPPPPPWMAYPQPPSIGFAPPSHPPTPRGSERESEENWEGDTLPNLQHVQRRLDDLLQKMDLYLRGERGERHPRKGGTGPRVTMAQRTCQRAELNRVSRPGPAPPGVAMVQSSIGLGPPLVPPDRGKPTRTRRTRRP